MDEVDTCVVVTGPLCCFVHFSCLDRKKLSCLCVALHWWICQLWKKSQFMMAIPRWIRQSSECVRVYVCTSACVISKFVCVNVCVVSKFVRMCECVTTCNVVCTYLLCGDMCVRQSGW